MISLVSDAEIAQATRKLASALLQRTVRRLKGTRWLVSSDIAPNTFAVKLESGKRGSYVTIDGGETSSRKDCTWKVVLIGHSEIGIPRFGFRVSIPGQTWVLSENPDPSTNLIKAVGRQGGAENGSSYWVKAHPGAKLGHLDDPRPD